jgi:hypothetical protein
MAIPSNPAGGQEHMLEDKTLKCKECGEDFVFSVGEQEFYTQKGFQNEPVRCAPCRQARKKERSASGAGQSQEREYERSY